jgi:alcohol dehydrogenase class IV
MRYNASAVPDRIRNIGLAMGLCIQDLPAAEAVELTITAIANLSQSIGIPNLLDAGVSREAFDAIAADALKEISTIFNPRNPKKDDVLRILENAYQ